jgi:imidazolonepropionase-like amidohydrolase
MSTIAITNVRVFDGTKLTELRTVVIENDIISTLTTGDTVVDGNGGTLLPGLIDSHIHLTDMENLKHAANWGVTTMLDMATRSSELVDSLRNNSALTDIRSCYHPASAPGSTQTTRMGFPSSSIVNGPKDAERFVVEQITLGANYIKLIIEDPAIMGSAALAPETIVALVEAAHRNNKRVFAHVTTVTSYSIAVNAGVDVLNHIPLDEPLPDSLVETIVNKGLIVIPTMVMMKGIYNKLGKINPRLLSMVMAKGLRNKLRGIRNPQALDYHNAERTIQALIEAGATIIAGTDANSDPKTFCILEHGKSLHEELRLMVNAGMKPIQALKSATSLPAKLLGLDDRGVIEIGKRADLVLVDGDPTVDIKATRAIKGVWIAGVQVR